MLLVQDSICLHADGQIDYRILMDGLIRRQDHALHGEARCVFSSQGYKTKDMEHKGQVYSASPLHSLTGNFGTHIGVDGLLEQLH